MATLLVDRDIHTIMAPVGSNHHFNLLPPVDIRIPKPLIKRSFLWSSQSNWTWLDCLRIEKLYKNKMNLTAVYERWP